MKQDLADHRSKERDLIFYLKVQFRRNASMQGTLWWIDGKKTNTFRSVLELANLISDAKNIKAGRKQEDCSFKDWQNKESVS